MENPTISKTPVFKTGSVPYKIEKTFYEMVDNYNDSKKKLDLLIQAKNKQLLQESAANSLENNEKTKEISSGNGEEELQNSLKDLEKAFENYITLYLEKYKSDPHDYNEIYFPAKKTPTKFVDIIAKICEKLDIFKDVRGSSSKKTISIYKTPLLPREDPWEEKKTKNPPKPPQKSEKKQEKPTKPLEKQTKPAEFREKASDIVEEEKNPYKFPPDIVTNLIVETVKDNSVVINCSIPDDNGSQITKYHVYSCAKKGEKSKKRIKTYEKNQMSIEVSEDLFEKIGDNSGNRMISFYITAENEIGESKTQDKPFKIICKPYKKYGVLLAGASIPINEEDIVDISTFDPLYSGKFYGQINEISLNYTNSLVLDGGVCVQWGFAIDSTEQFEINIEKNPELVEEMITTPFFPLKSNNLQTLVSSVACGHDFCLALSVQGELFSWGLNNYGQLGHGDNNARIFPTKLAFSRDFFCQIATGKGHCLALSEESQVFTWGYRQANDGIPIKDLFSNTIDFENVGIHLPTPRKLDFSLKVGRILCGGHHSLIVSQENRIFSWGDNEFGQLGVGFFYREGNQLVVNHVFPKEIKFFSKDVELNDKNMDIVDISCGESHNCVVFKENYGLYAWGKGIEGQLGDFSFKNQACPIKIMEKNWENTISLACGNNFSMFLSEKNEIFFCGDENSVFFKKNKEKPKSFKKLDIGIKGENNNISIEIKKLVAGDRVAGVLF